MWFIARAGDQLHMVHFRIPAPTVASCFQMQLLWCSMWKEVTVVKHNAYYADKAL